MPAPLRPPLSIDTIAIAPDGIVIVDTPCRSCQYNLRSLHLEARCPECNTPVALSVRGDLLSQANPDWVKTLQLGVLLDLASWAVATLALIRFFAFLRRSTRPLTTLIISFIGAVLSIGGGWLATTPDPSGLGEERYGISRRIVRVMLAIELAQDLILWSLTANAIPAPALFPLRISQRVLALVGVGGAIALLRYFAKLAQRIPDASIERRAGFLSWALPILMGYLQLLALLTTVFPQLARHRRAMVAVAISFVITLLLMFVVVIAYLLMLVLLNRRLAESAASARSSWKLGVET